MDVGAGKRLRCLVQQATCARAYCRFNHRTQVTVNLHEAGAKTRMEFRQTGLASEASRDSHIGGWCDSMDA
ncbi:MAG: SRPBCC domain-containing protein [Acidobacteria bacterium]|nr:SRPBCC domain-containing protein [Acidobacteriota bacterium]